MRKISSWHKVVLCMVLPLSALLSGCSSEPKTVQKYDDNANINYSEVRIEGCQYITWHGSHLEIGLTHKGNCDNPIHLYNKVQVETKIVPPVINK